MTRIDLPQMASKEGALTHAYPFQIGIQTQEFIQGAIFLGAFTDLAAGRQVRIPGGVEAIDAELAEHGLDRETIAQAWDILGKHRDLHKKWLFQNVLVLILSHWDWYIRKLATFVDFALRAESSRELSNRLAGKLEKIGFKGIIGQIDVIRSAVDAEIRIEQQLEAHLIEMAMVRNLGMHNRWEVDEKYRADSTCNRFPLGEIREFDSDELQKWHGALISAISETTRVVGMRFCKAPPYPVPERRVVV